MSQYVYVDIPESEKNPKSETLLILSILDKEYSACSDFMEVWTLLWKKETIGSLMVSSWLLPCSLAMLNAFLALLTFLLFWLTSSCDL